MITKKEQVERLKGKLDENLKARFTKKDAERIYDLVAETLEEALEEGGAKFGNLFTMRLHDRAPRNGRNPQTGKAMKIAGKKVVKFKTSKTLAGKVAKIK